MNRMSGVRIRAPTTATGPIARPASGLSSVTGPIASGQIANEMSETVITAAGVGTTTTIGSLTRATRHGQLHVGASDMVPSPPLDLIAIEAACCTPYLKNSRPLAVPDTTIAIAVRRSFGVPRIVHHVLRVRLPLLLLLWLALTHLRRPIDYELPAFCHSGRRSGASFGRAGVARTRGEKSRLCFSVLGPALRIHVTSCCH